MKETQAKESRYKYEGGKFSFWRFSFSLGSFSIEFFLEFLIMKAKTKRQLALVKESLSLAKIISCLPPNQRANTSSGKLLEYIYNGVFESSERLERVSECQDFYRRELRADFDCFQRG